MRSRVTPGQGQENHPANMEDQPFLRKLTRMMKSGIYVVCMTLFLKDGSKQSHMISFDAYRDILCFGMDDEGFE